MEPTFDSLFFVSPEASCNKLQWNTFFEKLGIKELYVFFRGTMLV